MLLCQVPDRSVARREVPRAAATATAASAPTRNRAAAICGQGRWAAPSRVETFMPAKQSWASTIQASACRAVLGTGRGDSGAGEWCPGT